jgi:phage-related baseplate assembly protein
MFVNDIPVAQQIDLLRLPPPQIIATPAFEEVYEALWAQFVLLEPNYRYRLESDPVVKVIQAWAYERMLVESRINFAARQSLLVYAEGSVLDHMAAFYGITRQVISPGNESAFPPVPAVMEADSRLRDRIQLAIAGQAKRGGREYYRFHAMSADPRVLDAIAFSPDHQNGFNMGGQVIVCILSSEPGFYASDDLINIVDAALRDPTVKPLNDVLVVEGAVPKLIDITVKVKLKRMAQKSSFDVLEAKFREAFLTRQSLGSDITHSWIHDALYLEGIHSIKIEGPETDVEVQFNEFPVLGVLSIEFDGYADSDGYKVDEVEKARAMRIIYETYRKYCIANKATAAQIVADLPMSGREGIFEPTIKGFAEYLAIPITRNSPTDLLSEDEIGVLIHKKLSQNYIG